MKGTFITFEGIEGSGKSTQLALLAEHLASVGIRTTPTREPGGTIIGDQVRKILLDPENAALSPRAELMLYAAGRAQHVKEIIAPRLEAGDVVLCDRFSDATLAYQGWGRGLDVELIRTLDRIVCEGITPGLTVLFDLAAAEGVARARSRNRDRGLETESRFENEETVFHERVRRGYLALAEREPNRIKIVDAARSVNDVCAEVRAMVKTFIGPG
jgi:dTMP kinase